MLKSSEPTSYSATCANTTLNWTHALRTCLGSEYQQEALVPHSQVYGCVLLPQGQRKTLIHAVSSKQLLELFLMVPGLNTVSIILLAFLFFFFFFLLFSIFISFLDTSQVPKCWQWGLLLKTLTVVTIHSDIRFPAMIEIISNVLEQ